MEPVLIYTDTHRIALEKATLNKVNTLFQTVFDAINNTLPNFSFPDEVSDNRLQEINKLISWTVNGNGTSDFVKNYVLDKLDSLLGDYTHNGVILNAAIRRQLIVIPDLTAIEIALASARQVLNSTVNGAQLSLLRIINAEIYIADGADATIEALYTYYTKTDASAALAISLGVICTDLNTYANSYPEFLDHWLRTASTYMVQMGIPGIIIDGDTRTFVVDWQYIRKIEG